MAVSGIYYRQDNTIHKRRTLKVIRENCNLRIDNDEHEETQEWDSFDPNYKKLSVGFSKYKGNSPLDSREFAKKNKTEIPTFELVSQKQYVVNKPWKQSKFQQPKTSANTSQLLIYLGWSVFVFAVTFLCLQLFV